MPDSLTRSPSSSKSPPPPAGVGREVVDAPCDHSWSPPSRREPASAALRCSRAAIPAPLTAAPLPLEAGALSPLGVDASPSRPGGRGAACAEFPRRAEAAPWPPGRSCSRRCGDRAAVWGRIRVRAPGARKGRVGIAAKAAVCWKALSCCDGASLAAGLSCMRMAAGLREGAEREGRDPAWPRALWCLWGGRVIFPWHVIPRRVSPERCWSCCWSCCCCCCSRSSANRRAKARASPRARPRGRGVRRIHPLRGGWGRVCGGGGRRGGCSCGGEGEGRGG